MSLPGEEGTSQNMVSNLPLLFTNGYPTTLEDINEKELESFIPFMVQCSFGVGSAQSDIFSEKPEWWPEDVPFQYPFTKPQSLKGNWLDKMKQIVVMCYEYHNSIFLLRFCNELASYERELLRFINNYNLTTSLYVRTTNKLLVTFRNENMLYDQQPQNNIRRCLLPRNSSTHSVDTNPQMVEPLPLFDIYLCDNCDAELYSLQAYMEHEKSCQSDDDVIICEPDEIMETSDENHRKLSAFLSNFNLQSNIPLGSNAPKHSLSPKKDIPLSPEKIHRLTRRTRGVLPIARCPQVPFSSPLGQFLIQKSKSPTITEDYIIERLERIERFAYAPFLTPSSVKPRFMEKKEKKALNPIVTFKRSPDYINFAEYHYYRFPRRQFSTKRRDKDFEYLNSLLLKSCKPCTIPLKKLSTNDVNNYQINIRLKRLNNQWIPIKSNNNNQLNLNRINNKVANNKNEYVPKTSARDIKIVDVIDLCSSDDDDPSVICTTNTKKQIHSNLNTKKTSIQKLEGNILAIPIDSSSTTNTNCLISPKPLQPVYLFSNLSNKNPSIYDTISSKINNNATSIVKENGILKMQNAKNVPPLVRITSSTSSNNNNNNNNNKNNQRRGLTANL